MQQVKFFYFGNLDYHLENGLAPLSCIIDDDQNKEGLSYINLPVLIGTMICFGFNANNFPSIERML